jgi:hypothetical protein
MLGSLFAYFISKLLFPEAMRFAPAQMEVAGIRALPGSVSAVRFAREANWLRIFIPGGYCRG